MAIINKVTKNKCWRGFWEKGHCSWKCKLIQPLWRRVHGFRKKLKTEPPYVPAVPFLGIYLEKTVIQKDRWTSMFNVALFTTARMWKQPKCPLAEERIKMWYAHTTDYCSATERNKTVPCAEMWMYPETVTQTEVRPKEKNAVWYCLCAESRKMVQMNLFVKQKQSHTYRKQTYGYQVGEGGGMSWEIGTDTYIYYYT